jgi:hypothetical protein
MGPNDECRLWLGFSEWAGVFGDAKMTLAQKLKMAA